MGLTFGLVIDFATPTWTLDHELDRFRRLFALADQYGFDSVTMGEGHSARPQWGHTPAPMLMLAALAPTTKMRLGTGVTLLPGWQPLRLAEETAMLDQLSGGRLILGVGLGPPNLAHQYGVEIDQMSGYIDEMLAALRALWSGQNGFAGEHLTIETGIGIRPLQAGGPPIWVGGSARRSVRRAARLGEGYIGSTSQSLEQIAGLVEQYHEALRAEGKDPSAAVVASNRLTVVAETEAEARQLGEQYAGEVLGFYANRGAQMPKELVRAQKTPAELFHELNDSRCLVGTPEQVVATARRYEEAGVTHILARLTPHDIPSEHAERTVELLGKYVLPEFR